MQNRIPLPSADNPQFKDVMDYWQQLQEMKMKQPLMQAQTQEAQGNAAKSQMIANLINSRFGGGQGAPTTPNNTNQGFSASGNSVGNNNNSKSGIGNMSPNDLLLMSGALGMPTQVVDGNLITPFGSAKIGETATEKRLAEAQTDATKKTLESTSESALGGLGVNASFKALDELMKKPNYSHLSGTMEGKLINSQFMGIPTGSALQSMFPKTYSKEDAKLAGEVEAHFGNIVTGVAQKFKGPFKQMVQGIIDRMKPNMGDSLAVQQGKIATLKQLSDLADTQNALIDQYISQGMSSTAAILKVAKEVPLPQIPNEFSQNSEDTQSAQEPQNAPGMQSQTPNAQGGAPVSGTTDKPIAIMYKKDKSGKLKEYHIPGSLVQKALREGFTSGS